jgi:predicted DNA-binding protein (MmcQ/YjbR family)
MGNVLCFSISGGRLFCIFSFEDEMLLRISFKVEQHRFLEFTDQPQFIPAPYMGTCPLGFAGQ